MQPDLFNETLEKKIYRMEAWVTRIQKEIWFLREVYNLSRGKVRLAESKELPAEMDMFAS